MCKILYITAEEKKTSPRTSPGGVRARLGKDLNLVKPGDFRLVIMAGKNSIKEAIPFPKNSAGLSPMDDSPANVDEAQLKELHLQLLPSEKKELNNFRQTREAPL